MKIHRIIQSFQIQLNRMKQKNILSPVVYTTLLANPATSWVVHCKVYMFVCTYFCMWCTVCAHVCTCIHGHVLEHVGTDEWLCLCLSAVPDPPVSLSVVNFGTRALKATWLPPSEVFDDVASVRYRITVSADNVPSQTITALSQEQVISGLEPGTMYTVQVCCGNKILFPHHVCMCVRMCVHACVFACVLARVFAYVHTYVFACVHACICVSVCVHTHIHVWECMNPPPPWSRSSKTNLVMETVINSTILSNNSARERGGSPGCQLSVESNLAGVSVRCAFLLHLALRKASASYQNVGKITSNQKLVPGESPLPHAWISWEAPTSKIVQEKRKSGSGFIIWQGNFLFGMTKVCWVFANTACLFAACYFFDITHCKART